MYQVIVFLFLTALAVIAGVNLLIRSLSLFIAWRRKKTNPKQITRIKRMSIFFVITVVINIVWIIVTQFIAYTPKIVDDNGQPIEDSIAELTEVTLNGRKQWISIRGWDTEKPVLLFLAGGPGGTQMAAVRYELAELEKHFVVVNWDQPGSGKSYYSEKLEDITVETYMEDGYALTKYLLERFSQEKIYLMGESWGSALGIFLIDRYPEVYHGFIGTGQMIDFAETDRLDYEKAMEIAEEKGDEKLIKKLEKNGIPPYYGKDVTWKSAVFVNYLSAYMANNPDIENPGYQTLRDIGASEYGLLDKINFFRGIVNTYNQVYQQLYELDLRRDYTKLEVPVYFFLGRHDVNAPTSLVEDYMEVLDAPHKEIVWFEHSGHSPWINERDQFVDEVLTCFSNK